MERIIIKTKLDGFIRIDAPGGKFNNCSFGFKIPEKNLDWFEEQYQGAIDWAHDKYDGKRLEEALQPWEEDGSVSYSYGGDTSRPFFSFVDDEGEPLTESEAKAVGKGTEVVLSIGVKGYIFGKKGGLSLRVLGGRILNLVTFGSEPVNEEEVLDDLLNFKDEEEEKPKRTARKAKAKPVQEEEGEDELPF